MYNTTNPSGNNVIEKARLARLKRENLKVQEKSIIVIQRHARGYLTRLLMSCFNKRTFDIK